MPNQPNKPDGEEEDGGPRPVDQRQAVENQSSVTPQDYPEPSGGKPDYKKP